MSALAPLCALVLLTLAGICKSSENVLNIHPARNHGKVELPAGCLYDGRWHRVGAAVRTSAACLSCACASGALSCRRLGCPPLPAPPPRCHTLHRRDDCCPHIHCPDGVQYLAPDVSTDEIIIEHQHSALALPACVEGGTVYAAGSAMSSDTACEQCFCLGGARRCVRPQCLPPPPGCQARPASGACCPQRYYCNHFTTITPTEHRNSHDCQTPDGLWVEEGKSVASSKDACTQCFCLRGHIQCQHLSCAPTVQGCTPLVQPGQCCPHQYLCNHTKPDAPNQVLERLENYLELAKNEDRSFQYSKSTKRETIISNLSTALDKNVSTTTINKLPTTISNLKTTSEETPSTIVGTESVQTEEDLIKDITSVTELSTTEESTDSSTTEQPEGSVRIMINGTINCTSELSSTSFYNITNVNDTLKMHMEAQPRTPFSDGTEIEAQTFSADKFITERDRNEELNDNESFVINVTSSLRTNVTFPSSVTVSVTSTTILPKTESKIITETHNISKKTKEDADFDYGGPTLPPSLPNLKIIPFVAADAVLDEELAPKESSYSELQREDKFPIYYPSIDENSYSNHRENLYNPSQQPIFTNNNKDDYILSHQIPEIYPNKIKDIGNPMEFTIGASFNNAKDTISEQKISIMDNINLEKPAENLFSPPIETEGGFIPKGPGIVDDYYRVYPTTPSGPVNPHITNSGQLENKGACLTNDGKRVGEGESLSQACSMCTCAWGELHCSPRPCSAPPGCFRRPAEVDLCCGEVICGNGNLTKPADKSGLYNSTQVYSQVNKDDIINSFVNPIEISITTSKSEESNNVDESGSLLESNKTQMQTTPTLSTTSLRPNIATGHTKLTVGPQVQINETNTKSEEYEDDDTDDGFSLGSVLQLLLSETYETTTTAPFKKMPPIAYTLKRPINPPQSTTTETTTTTTTTTTIKPSQLYPTSQYSFTPSKKFNIVNRIDHLVLGEATAIRKTTSRPITTKYITTRKIFMKPTPRPITTKNIEITSKGQAGQTIEPRPPNMIPSLISGLPKVAGCNIYGRMYRVGRIIAELSTPCQECKCTEQGVQCRQLTC